MRPGGARRLVPAVIIAALVSSFAACGSGGDPAGLAGKQIKQLPAELVPSPLLDLQVRRENMRKSLATAKRAYIDGVGLYSLRSKDLVVATLQISRFTKDAKYGKQSFQRLVTTQIGSSKPQAFRMGSTTIYLTAGTKQRIAVWFRGRYSFVLAIRDDYTSPRALMRRSLELDV